MRVYYECVAVLSFAGNLLLFVAICNGRHLLFKTNNLLAFHLAITDLLTGLFQSCMVL